MPLTTCLDCGAEISTKAQACPKCGRPANDLEDGTKQTPFYACPNCIYLSLKPMEECPDCTHVGSFNEITELYVCRVCKHKSLSFLDRCPDCEEADSFTQLVKSQINFNDYKRGDLPVSTIGGATNVILTTAHSLEGFRVVETLEVITAEAVFGMNFFLDLFASLSDVFGGRSKASQMKLREARRVCLAELKKEAVSIGANAVIAVDLDYSEFSGKGKSMLFLVASGTAVKVERLQDESADK